MCPDVLPRSSVRRRSEARCDDDGQRRLVRAEADRFVSDVGGCTPGFAELEQTIRAAAGWR